MTMTTSVRINAPVNPVRLLDKLTELVGGDPGTAIRRDSESWSTPGALRLSNAIGQGFAALCDVEWHPDGPLATATEYHEPDEEPYPPALVECSFDTAYGYRGDNGEGCGDLHHWLLIELRNWLDEQGIASDQAWWHAGEFYASPHAVGGYSPLWDLSTQTGDPTRVVPPRKQVQS